MLPPVISYPHVYPLTLPARASRLLLNVRAAAQWKRSAHGSDASSAVARRLENVSARVTSLMDFNIDRGSMLKLCHERILDCAAAAAAEERGEERTRYYISFSSDHS